MELIDEDGNLFGRVNVIDALVVLFVLAVLVAGVALLGVFDDQETETRYATIDLGEQPDYVIDRVEEGDVVEHEGTADNITITDTYKYETEESDAAVIQVEVNGERIVEEDGEDRFEYLGEPLQIGRELTIDTDAYQVEGTITEAAVDRPELNIEETQVLIETSIPATTADEIAEGDERIVGGTTISEVESVSSYGTEDSDQRRVFIGATLLTRSDGNTPLFGEEPIRPGGSVRIAGSGYDVSGDVVRRGTTDLPGEASTTTVTLVRENVEPTEANNIREGLTETNSEGTIAEVQSVDSEPAETVLTSEDGDIFLREHPRNRDLTIDVELQTRDVDGSIWFKGDTIQEGDSVAFDLGSTTLAGEIDTIDETQSE